MNYESPPKVKEFVGLADYLGNESVSEGGNEIFRVTVNDYTFIHASRVVHRFT